MKFLIFLLMMLFTCLIFANPLPDPVEYRKYSPYDSGWDHYDRPEKNYTFYRETMEDDRFNVNRETVVYRGKYVENELIEVVMFQLDDSTAEEFKSNFFIADNCAEDGEYLYISNLNCEDFVGKRSTYGCRNYIGIDYDESGGYKMEECDETLYTTLSMDEEEFRSLMTQTFYDASKLLVKEDMIDFGDVYVGEFREMGITFEAGSRVYSSKISPNSMEFESTDFSFVPDSCSCYEVFTDNQCVCKVRFTPTKSGEISEFVNLRNYGDMIEFRGNGIDLPEVDADVDVNLDVNETVDDETEKGSSGCALVVL